MVATENLEPLSKIREKSGLSIARIIELASEVDPRFPQTHAGYLGIEEHGTRDYWKIHALASVYGLPVELVAKTVSPKK